MTNKNDSVPVLVAVAWPYASGSRHLGHLAGAYLPADVFARFQRLAGNEVLMVSGSDVHGTPITVRADSEGTTPGEIVGFSNEGLIVKTGDSTISLDKLEVVPSTANELIECRFRIGQHFGSNNWIVMSELLERVSKLELQLALSLKE